MNVKVSRRRRCWLWNLLTTIQRKVKYISQCIWRAPCMHDYPQRRDFMSSPQGEGGREIIPTYSSYMIPPTLHCRCKKNPAPIMQCLVIYKYSQLVIMFSCCCCVLILMGKKSTGCRALQQCSAGLCIDTYEVRKMGGVGQVFNSS